MNTNVYTIRWSRANWAQANAHEAFASFAAAVIIASMAEANQSRVDALGYNIRKYKKGCRHD